MVGAALIRGARLELGTARGSAPARSHIVAATCTPTRTPSATRWRSSTSSRRLATRAPGSGPDYARIIRGSRRRPRPARGAMRSPLGKATARWGCVASGSPLLARRGGERVRARSSRRPARGRTTRRARLPRDSREFADPFMSHPDAEIMRSLPGVWPSSSAPGWYSRGDLGRLGNMARRRDPGSGPGIRWHRPARRA
jgi:hypothetical protein